MAVFIDYFFIMINRYLILLISDIKIIVRAPVLLSAVLSPFLLTIIILIVSSLIPGLYYSLAALTLIAGTPIIYGLVFSAAGLNSHPDVHSAPKSETLLLLRERIAYSSVTCFAVLIPVIFLTDAVPGEGWIRSIFASVLFSALAPLVFLLSACLATGTKKVIIQVLFCILLLITVPVGLLLHHPLNYFAFYSPLYWAVWAWAIGSPSESLMYGSISLGLSSAGIFLLYRYSCRRKLK